VSALRGSSPRLKSKNVIASEAKQSRADHAHAIEIASSLRSSQWRERQYREFGNYSIDVLIMVRIRGRKSSALGVLVRRRAMER
jgi:hypothetical protein